MSEYRFLTLSEIDALKRWHHWLVDKGYEIVRPNK